MVHWWLCVTWGLGWGPLRNRYYFFRFLQQEASCFMLRLSVRGFCQIYDAIIFWCFQFFSASSLRCRRHFRAPDDVSFREYLGAAGTSAATSFPGDPTVMNVPHGSCSSEVGARVVMLHPPPPNLKPGFGAGPCLRQQVTNGRFLCSQR